METAQNTSQEEEEGWLAERIESALHFLGRKGMRIYLVVLPLLAGCVSAEQLQERQAAYRAGLERQCAAYGITQQPDLGQCMMRVDLANRQNQAARDAADAALSQQAIQGLQRSGPAIAPAPRAPTSTNCMQRGNRIECDTY